MWLLKNRTPFAVERSWTRDERGLHWWIVVARATYRLGEGGPLALADDQLPVELSPEYFGDDGASSLRLDSDLVAVKPGTDVIVDACAHAPRGRAQAKVPVALRIADQLKQLVVYGERVYYDGATGLATTAPAPFVRQPIRYEGAAGGVDRAEADESKRMIDERNPVGRGFGRTSGWVNERAHVVEFTTGRWSSAGPAGFGPIDRGWLPRRPLAGTYDKAWVERKKPLLPDDYDSRFAMSAPADQQRVPWLVGGEVIGLDNLHPAGAVAFEIPRVSLRCTSRFGRRRQGHGANLTTVFVEPEHDRVTLCWQSTLQVRAPDLDYLDETEIELS